MVKKLKLIAKLVVAVIVIQWTAILLLTPGGIERIYPYFVRLSGETVNPETNSYAVYYDTRADVAAADIVVIGVDYNVAESWTMLGHFTRFLKQYNNFSSVIFDMTDDQASLADGILAVTNEERFYKRIGILENKLGTSIEQCEYLMELYYINRTVVPAKKFEILSYPFVMEENGLTPAQAVASCLESSERGAVCIVDSRLLEWDSGFRDELDDLTDGRAVYFRTHYAESCASPETHTAYKYPFDGIGRADGESRIKLIRDDSFGWIYSYYRTVTGLFGADADIDNRLDERNTEFFFMVSGGNEVTYALPEENGESTDNTADADTADTETHAQTEDTE